MRGGRAVVGQCVARLLLGAAGDGRLEAALTQGEAPKAIAVELIRLGRRELILPAFLRQRHRGPLSIHLEISCPSAGSALSAYLESDVSIDTQGCNTAGATVGL